jgi:hypothetical protein
MKANDTPTLFYEFHCHEPHVGLETLWFYKAFDPDGPDPSDDPNAIKLVGPASSRECATAGNSIKRVLQALGQEIAEEHGADD